ncbi:MAG: hypothetical protein M1839_004540 [Geoglossum umbratile]|nr:MAG: hypothetical protein M1839_004540 [Geoglossum umbratile]
MLLFEKEEQNIHLLVTQGNFNMIFIDNTEMSRVEVILRLLGRGLVLRLGSLLARINPFTQLGFKFFLK